MIKEKIVTELKYYQKYLGELISHFYINEAICNLYDTQKEHYCKFGICLGNISDTLNYRQHMLCYLLFHYDKESKSIPRLLNKVRDIKISNDEGTDKELKKLAEELRFEINEANTDIESLKEYRYDVYAHWNKNIFDEDWQKDFANKHPFDYEKIIGLSVKSFNIFKKMLSLLDEESFELSIIQPSHIDLFIEKLSK